MAHDFNNLLGVVIGNLDFLAEKFAPGTDEAKLTGAAIGAAERGATLIRRLLAFARRQPLAPKLTRLPDVMHGAAQLFRRTLGEHITLELKLPDDLWPVLIDVSQLESSLLNLAVNARDAMPEGGQLTIEAQNVTLDALRHGAQCGGDPWGLSCNLRFGQRNRDAAGDHRQGVRAVLLHQRR